MSPQFMLTFSAFILLFVGIILFGAPFLPPLRPFAFPLLTLLVTLGNIFVFLVIFVTVGLVVREKNAQRVQ